MVANASSNADHSLRMASQGKSQKRSALKKRKPLQAGAAKDRD
ncbi:hypothetical protein HPTD01_1292 [Halomonas sp. TD01]|nr:hypothetical protein HPTD01_1292 [Halomonas sp. TD01]